MTKDFKIGDLVRVYGSDSGEIGLIVYILGNTRTVLFPNGERETVGLLWLSIYEE